MAEVLPKTSAEVAELHSYHPDILRLAKFGYALISQLKKVWDLDPETIYQKHYCEGVKLAFYDGLIRLGYDPRSVIRTRGLLQPHHLIDLDSDRGWILVDGNWQQFVPPKKRTSSLPRVAVGTAAEIVDLAANAGVKEANLVYWAEKRAPSVKYEQRTRLEPPRIDLDDDKLDLLTYRLITE